MKGLESVLVKEGWVESKNKILKPEACKIIVCGQKGKTMT